MQTPRRCQVGLQLPCCLIILIAIALTMPAGAQDSAAVQKVEGPHKFYLGYDQGISARYQINPRWSAGVIVSSDRWGSLYSTGFDSTRYNDGRSSKNLNEIQDFFIYGEAIRVFKRWRHFTVRGFASIGAGRFSQDRTNRYYESENILSSSYLTEETTIHLASRAGLIPGFTYGIFTFETRLGLEARMSTTTSPANSSPWQTGDSESLSLVYPSSFLAGIIVHFALF